MNLKQLVQLIAFGLNFTPEDQDYDDAVVAVINSRYEHICQLRSWLFLQKKVELSLYASIDGATVHGTININANPYFVTMVGYALQANGLPGQTIIIAGTEYTIAEIPTSNLMRLTTPYTGASGVTDWQIEFRRYSYPADAGEILDIVSRDDQRGKLVYIDWRTEAELFLDSGPTGEPGVYIEDEPITLLTPEAAPVLAATGVGGALVVDHVYQYCYTFFDQGLESAPSVISELTATATGQISVSEMDNTTVGGFSTKPKWLYRRDKTAGTRWRKVAEIPAATAYVDNGAATTLVNDVYLYEPGPRFRFRVWNTASTTKQVEVRYLSAPPKLYADGDVPAWPQAHHHVLVSSALVELCRAHGMPGDSQRHALKEKEGLAAMEGKYLSRQDRQYIRRSFDRSLLQSERWGDPVKI